jgi:hypothetical protein
LLTDALDLIRKRIRRTLRDKQSKESGFQSQQDEKIPHANDRFAHLRANQPLSIAFEQERSELIVRLAKGEDAKPSSQLQKLINEL